ncbi:hypothetical protein SNEBB_001740 [Seison nebaliae]|nr:hypothetical protein SNEBB_001740 [Seison nebaliae]
MKIAQWLLVVMSIQNCYEANDENIYRYTIDTLNHGLVRLKLFRNKVLLLMNTASECEKYPPSLFRVVLFPSNQFGEQEPQTDEEIQFWLKDYYDINHSVIVVRKGDVIGKDINPLWKEIRMKPTWNFWKYIVNSTGYVVHSVPPTTSLESITHLIDEEIEGISNREKDL